MGGEWTRISVIISFFRYGERRRVIRNVLIVCVRWEVVVQVYVFKRPSTSCGDVSQCRASFVISL